MGILMYVFALLGLALFAGELRFDENGQHVPLGSDQPATVPRLNFDSLPVALLSIFKVLMTSEWHTLFYDCVRGAGISISFFYFVSLVTMGQIALMNLFLVVLLDTFKMISLTDAVQIESDKL